MKMLNVRQVSQRLGITRATLWRWRDADKFPAPDGAEGRQQLWDQDTVDRWLEANPDGRPRRGDRFVIEFSGMTAKRLHDAAMLTTTDVSLFVNIAMEYYFHTVMKNDHFAPVGWEEIERLSGRAGLDELLEFFIDWRNVFQGVEGYLFVVRIGDDIEKLTHAEIVKLHEKMNFSNEQYRVVKIQKP